MTMLFAVRQRFPIKENCRSLGCAPNDTGASGLRFSAAPTALRSCSELSPSHSGLGSRFGGRPSPGFPVELGGFDPTLVKVFEAMDSIGGYNGVEISGSTAMRVYSFSHIGKEYWAALSNANPELQRHSV
jgi:hypothetical protein